ncbi:MAG: beta-galactosidase [Eubacteriales bacterium]|nr:beta-galactosidase [Eubacteriales bacterium]
MNGKEWENLPQIRNTKTGDAALYVEGKEFFVLGGEVHNSVSSSMAYMDEYVWNKLAELPMNTLLVPVHWELVEKEKGEFDFSLPRQIIDRARAAKIRLIFLWFGLWKNGASNYAPAWMKRDSKRYFRARCRGGKPSETISCFCEEAVEADAEAFGKLMAFLREYDGQEHTVIMVQVENEVGFYGEERDFGSEAEKKYQEPVPEAVSRLYGKTGNWEQVFDYEAPEYFMSWYMAGAMERIAAAGKREYPIPMFANVWLEQFPFRPGTYPSGGPIARMIPIWKEAAKSIDMLSPDIYHSDFYGCCDRYALRNNPLFIPETARQPLAASNLLGALGCYHNLIGFSPFGIDDLLNAPVYAQMQESELDALLIDWQWDRCLPENTEYLRRAYKIVEGVWELYRKEKEEFIGFARRNENEDGTVIPMGKYDVLLKYPETKNRAGSGGFLFPVNEFCFYIAGCNVQISLAGRRASGLYAEPVGMWEGRFENGEFIPGRKQNGDRLYQQSRLADMPTVLKFEVGIYE